MEDLDTITSDLAEADLGGMISDIDHLVSSSEDSVQNALNQLNSIDIDTLNQAINHLNDTVTPFANFFNKFLFDRTGRQTPSTGAAALSVLHVLPFLPIFRNRSAPSRLTADV